MKLIFLMILLCGITSTPTHTMNSVKSKKTCMCHQKTTAAKATGSNLDIMPAGLLFQF